MDIGSALCTFLCILVLANSSNLSFSYFQSTDEFRPVNCTTHKQCDKVCFQGPTLFNRCDVNGTCVCDCSDKTYATSSYPEQCAGRQPDGFWRDYCDTYCNREYLRPFKYCNNSFSQFYCTCVCVNPNPKP